MSVMVLVQGNPDPTVLPLRNDAYIDLEITMFQE